MFQLILGRAGSGKTYKVRKLLMHKARTGEKKLLLLVPEQISFENEKAMVNVLGSKGSRILEITTFTRLVDFVFRKVGGFAGTRLDDGARNMIMSLAIEQVRPYLDLYKRHSDKEEFIKLMIDAVKEFRTCGVSKNDIDGVINEIDNVALKEKLKETSMIMSAYDALVGQSYLDPLNNLTHLYDVLLQNNIFEDYIVAVDSFDGFTHQEMKVLECIMTQAKEFYVTLCTDSCDWAEENFDLLSPVRKTAYDLIKIAQRNCIEILEPIKLESTYRFYESGISALEKNVFQAEKNICDQQCKDVIIFNARDIYDEVDYVARTIRKLVIEENIRYREIAIISRSTEKYDDIIDNIFKKYDVPVFIERNENVNFKPLMNLVLTALDIVISNFKSEKIFKFLKTGLVPFSVEEISILENYVLLWNLDNLDWTSDFKLHPRGFADNFTESDVDNLSLINSIRLRIIEPFLEFKESLIQKSGVVISKSLYGLLLRLDVEKNLIKMFEYFNSIAQKNLADEQIRLWDLLMSILDQMSIILGDKPISLRRYRELLDITISSSEISFIPQELDEVKFGSAERMRPNHPRITFVIGAVQGEFPQYPSNKGIFSDSQRKKLISLGINVYDPLEKMSIKEQFIAYRAITSPSERLYVTWPAIGKSSVSNQPSSIVSEIKKILKHVKTVDYIHEDKSERLFSEKAGFEQCAKYFYENSVFADTVKKYFLEDEKYKEILNSFETLKSHKCNLSISKEISKKLFGHDMCISASQIEKFYLCRFQYFCCYGIGAKERKPAVFDALEYGNLMHFILERVFSQSVTEEDITEKIKQSLNEYVENKLGGFENKTSRFKYLFSRLSNSIEIVIKYIFTKNQQTNFKPVDFEIPVKEGGDIVPLSFSFAEGGTVKIEGKIDRVDLMKKDDKTYLRIVDYKSGVKQFKLSDILYGVNMQMLIYLASIIKNKNSRYGEAIPAGVLYMPTSLSVANIDREIKNLESVDKKRLDAQFKMNGLILNDPDVVIEMNKDSKTDTVVSLAEMGAVLKKVESLAVEMSEILREGNISAKPSLGEVKACEYCMYASVCGLDDESEVRKIEKISNQEVIEKIMKKI